MQTEDRKIISNRIRTPDGTVLISNHRHDYVTYKDKNGYTYMVDGGNEYLRRNIVEEAPYTELTVYRDAPFLIIRKVYSRGGRGKNGNQSLVYVPLYKMSNEWLKACVVYNDGIGLANSFASKMYLKELEFRKKNKINILDNE